MIQDAVDLCATVEGEEGDSQSSRPRSTRHVEQFLSHFGLSFIRPGAGHDIWGPTP